MPLFEMSPNVQEPNAARKRSHDEYSGDEGEDTKMDEKTPSKPDVRPCGDSRKPAPAANTPHGANETVLPPITNNPIGSSPQGSPALTEAGSSTAACNSPSPETPTKAGAVQDASTAQTSNPAAKRKKLTPAEREAREKEAAEKREQKDREAAQRKKERDEKAAQKAAEKAKQEEEKVARQKERDDKRKKKEEEEKLKADEREEKKKQKEEEQKRIQEEKEKKARAQPKLMSFFGKPATPKKTAPTVIANASPSKGATEQSTEETKTTETPYQKLFQPFFIKENTRLAPSSSNMDEETRELKSKILDECIAGQRKADVTFDPVSLFALPGVGKPRGKQHHPVRHIMEGVYQEMERSGTTASADIIQAARQKLVGIPVKIIAFSRDVRPPYYGTITYRPFALGQGNMKRVARRSASRRLQLEYDYDSEAEWQEEEGEDLDADDDDEELDDEDDMDGFLDDSEDSGLARRTFGNTMEPETTGICFENEHRKVSSQAATDNKMEMILGMCLSLIQVTLTNFSRCIPQKCNHRPFRHLLLGTRTKASPCQASHRKDRSNY